jgi:hypothetical protein
MQPIVAILTLVTVGLLASAHGSEHDSMSNYIMVQGPPPNSGSGYSHQGGGSYASSYAATTPDSILKKVKHLVPSSIDKTDASILALPIGIGALKAGAVKGILVKGAAEKAIGTAVLAGPAIAANAKVASKAAAIPLVLAAKGALLGKAIAAPVILASKVGTFIALKIAGKLVLIPVAIKTGAKLAALKAAELKKAILIKKAVAVAKAKALGFAAKKALLKPIVIIGGKKLIEAGKLLAIKGAGEKLAGAALLGAGAKAKAIGAGSSAIGSGLFFWGLDNKLVKGALGKFATFPQGLDSIITKLPKLTLPELPGCPLATLRLPSLPEIHLPELNLPSLVRGPSSSYSSNTNAISY